MQTGDVNKYVIFKSNKIYVETSKWLEYQNSMKTAKE